MLYSIILACTLDGGIGYENNIPWDIKSEMALFRQITTEGMTNYKKNAVIMGRKTWESLSYKPLKNRINIIIGNIPDYENILNFRNLKDAFEYCERKININNVFVIGGKSIYETCLQDYAETIEFIYISVIYKNYICDKKIDIRYILQNFEAINNTVYFHPQYLHMKMIKKQKPLLLGTIDT
jgi:dihydrofolate reductase